MRAIILKFENDDELVKLLDKAKKFDNRSAASLARKALQDYCLKIIVENQNVK